MAARRRSFRLFWSVSVLRGHGPAGPPPLFGRVPVPSFPQHFGGEWPRRPILRRCRGPPPAPLIRVAGVVSRRCPGAHSTPFFITPDRKCPRVLRITGAVCRATAPCAGPRGGGGCAPADVGCGARVGLVHPIARALARPRRRTGLRWSVGLTAAVRARGRGRGGLGMCRRRCEAQRRCCSRSAHAARRFVCRQRPERRARNSDPPPRPHPQRMCWLLRVGVSGVSDLFGCGTGGGA